VAIELLPEVINRKDLIGDDDFDLTANQTLKVQTTGEGGEKLSVKCPVGKKWRVHVAVIIQEVDA